MHRERWEGDTSFIFLTIIFSNNKITYMEIKRKNLIETEQQINLFPNFYRLYQSVNYIYIIGKDWCTKELKKKKKLVYKMYFNN